VAYRSGGLAATGERSATAIFVAAMPKAQLTAAIKVTFAVFRAQLFLLIYDPQLTPNQNLGVLVCQHPDNYQKR
jgi:hypothetical protein